MSKYIRKENIIVKLTFEFSLDIMKYCEQLEMQKRFVIANQLLRAATSIGANIWEAQEAESRFDFIHKFKIAGKESVETYYWLLLCKYSINYPDPSSLIEKLESIRRIITKIIASSKRNINPETTNPN